MKKPERVVPTRRQFLTTTAGATAGMASWLALGKAPAFAQKRELTLLSWNHFVPASDEELRKQAEAFGKVANCTVRVDTMAHLQMPAKVAAEAQSQSGHDMYRTNAADPFLYENHLASVDDVVERVGKQGGGWYSFATESCQTKSGWKSIPWFWISFPGTYNTAHFKKAGFENPPKTWDDLLKMGKVLKKQGNPVGLPISHCSDAHSTYWSVAWSFGAKVLEADGKTPGISSDKTAQVIEWYKELYKDAMEPEVLSWDDSGNNRFMLSGKGSWIHNPVSPYNAALANKQPIADDISHHTSLAGAAGRHSAPPILSLGIWKFSKNQELAKEFVAYLFQKQNYDAWIVASNAFNHPPLKNLADHPIWARNPKLAMLPGEAEFAHPRGWPAKPNEAVQLIDNNYIMADMVAKAINGMPTKRAMDWAQEQIALAVKGQMKKG
jgi:multiple sugar transport system substrate-binding protein